MNAFMLASLDEDCKIVKYLIENKFCPFQDILDINKKSNVMTYISMLRPLILINCLILFNSLDIMH